MNHQPFLLVIACTALSNFASSFAPRSPTCVSFGLQDSVTSKISNTGLFAGSGIVQKYFQLEELEDKETTTTELFLESEGTVQIGETDGPKPSKAVGTWSLGDNNFFEMTITRTFQGGKQESEFTDIGEFSFDVVRNFSGETTFVGKAAAITGSMNAVDEKGDVEVGYFNMIDTTDERGVP